MSMPTATLPPPPPPSEPLWRLSVEQYHEMIKAGILTDEDPVELLDGWLVQKMPKDPIHRHVVRLLNDRLASILGDAYHIQTHDPITLATSEPEPDIAVIRGRADQFPHRHPGADDVALVIEVADSSLRRDRGYKQRIYAGAAIIQYWIVNLIDRQIEVYGEPDAETREYRQHTDHGMHHELTVTVDGNSVGALRLADLLPTD